MKFSGAVESPVFDPESPSEPPVPDPDVECKDQAHREGVKLLFGSSDSESDSDSDESSVVTFSGPKRRRVSWIEPDRANATSPRTYCPHCVTCPFCQPSIFMDDFCVEGTRAIRNTFINHVPNVRVVLFVQPLPECEKEHARISVGVLNHSVPGPLYQPISKQMHLWIDPNTGFNIYSIKADTIYITLAAHFEGFGPSKFDEIEVNSDWIENEGCYAPDDCCDTCALAELVDITPFWECNPNDGIVSLISYLH